MFVEGFPDNYLQKKVEECWREKASLSDAESRLEEISLLFTQQKSAGGMVIEGLDDLYESFYESVDSSEDVLYPIKCFLEVNELVQEVLLVLQMILD